MNGKIGRVKGTGRRFRPFAFPFLAAFLFAFAPFCNSHGAPVRGEAPEAEKPPPDIAAGDWTMLALRADFGVETARENAAPSVFGLALGLGNTAVFGNAVGVSASGLFLHVDGGCGISVGGLMADSSLLEGSTGDGVFRGIQFGTAAAFAEDLVGIQGAFVFAGDGRVRGVAASGLLAYVDSGAGAVFSPLLVSTGGGMALANPGHPDPFYGITAAGIVNAGGDVCGVQAALGASVAERCDGIQFSFLWNRATELNGVQAGAFNRADRLCGLQIGLINWAGSGSGVQVGFFNAFGHAGEEDHVVLPFLNIRF